MEIGLKWYVSKHKNILPPYFGGLDFNFTCGHLVSTFFKTFYPTPRFARQTLTRYARTVYFKIAFFSNFFEIFILCLAKHILHILLYFQGVLKKV